jgi:hypothetical protein
MQFFSQNPVFKKEYQNHGIVICQTGAKFTGSLTFPAGGTWGFNKNARRNG